MCLRKLLQFVSFLLIICSVSSHLILQDLIAQKNENGSNTNVELEDARKRKQSATRYIFPLLVAALLVKSVVFPLAFKAMAVMSSVSVVLSTMSLIISSMIAYAKAAIKSSVPVRFIHKYGPDWAKNDNNHSLKQYQPNLENYDLFIPSQK